MKVVLDIETNKYLNRWTYEQEGEPRITCVVAIDISTKRVYKMTNSIQFREVMHRVSAIVMHNGVEYDFPVLQELWGIDYDIARHTRGAKAKHDILLGNDIRLIDTLILSRMVRPERRKHGLESYTDECGLVKPEVDFVEDSITDILDRCEADCWLTLAVYEGLVGELKGQDIRDAYAREKHVADINQRRETRGVGFDEAKALEHCDTLDALMAPLAANVLPLLPSEVKLPKSKLKFPPKTYFLKKMGEPTKNTIKYFGDELRLDEDTYVWYYKDIKLKDYPHDQPLVTHRPTTMKDVAIVQDWLKGNGWVPQFYNKSSVTGEKTTPKIRENGNLCPSLVALSHTMPEINDYVLYNSYQHRRNTLKSSVNDVKGWCNNVRLKYDGRLTPGANPCGAVTRRFTHREVANVPRVTYDKHGTQTSIFGKEMRELFLP